MFDVIQGGPDIMIELIPDLKILYNLAEFYTPKVDIKEDTGKG